MRPSPQGATKSWMQEMFNYPDITGSVSAPRENPRDTLIVTGSAPAPKEPEKKDDKKDGDKKD